MVASKKLGLILLFLSCQLFVFAQTYTNPVLAEDYSDPDIIRVGNTYYMTASSFHHVPGLPLLSSTDLVHWHLQGYALDSLAPYQHFKHPQHGGGVWAPSIRYHKNRFYIYYPDPDFGIYMIQAKDFKGPWSAPTLVASGKGLIDPCPFWDDNGNAYLVHALAGSRAGIKSVLYLQSMNASGTNVVGDRQLIYDGHGIDPTIEGPKIYKQHGWYYIFAPAGGVKEGWQVVLRSKNINGPYERKVVMEQGQSTTNGPHQGAWVTTQNNEDWFLHFQDRGAFGRIMHLQPMTWKNDWPIIGAPQSNGIGNPVLEYRSPKGLLKDTIKENNSLLHFQWNGNPEWFWKQTFYNEQRFYAVTKKDPTQNLWNFPAIYNRKINASYPNESFTLDFHPNQIGEKTGVIVFGMNYATLQLENTKDGLQLFYVTCVDANKGMAEQKSLLLSSAPSQLKVRLQFNNQEQVSFSYLDNHQQWITLPNLFTMVPGQWVGATMGIFCSAEKSTNDAGYVVLQSFTIQ
jgi:beta-xylosidase